MRRTAERGMRAGTVWKGRFWVSSETAAPGVWTSAFYFGWS